MCQKGLQPQPQNPEGCLLDGSCFAAWYLSPHERRSEEEMHSSLPTWLGWHLEENMELQSWMCPVYFSKSNHRYPVFFFRGGRRGRVKEQVGLGELTLFILWGPKAQTTYAIIQPTQYNSRQTQGAIEFLTCGHSHFRYALLKYTLGWEKKNAKYLIFYIDFMLIIY